MFSQSHLGVMFFNVRKSVFSQREQSPQGDSSRREQGQDPSRGPRAGPEVSVFRAGYRTLKMGIRTLEKLAVLQKQPSSRAQPVRVPVTTARMF